ncbi:putative phage protein (TIGR02218 family) [Aliiruegeria haliotis]|uniref:Putative phage protein (TIGR02218 family) n=1 Tax=Aliiruegeria haliotis TaxID=1280846 RepID=A0A2T0RYH2_9RHOB|nr:DUF2163 domain-containing protein [Aliiruegeria haliotis]PRY26221.1 putative phage protein (TIGR02218 family) [Aliiruegeria haliotis]
MSTQSAERLNAHLQGGAATTCRCWEVRRADGAVLGFTDHDEALEFDGIAFAPNSGFTSTAFEQTTGLSVDNASAIGALSHEAIKEADIRAGRYDGAAVTVWLVNWRDLAARDVQFAGTIGEISHGHGRFEAELRGLAEQLNQPQGHVYQGNCSAVLGDGRCGLSLEDPGFYRDVAIAGITGAGGFLFEGLDGLEDRWFELGRFRVLSGAGTGLVGMIKRDTTSSGGREIELWQELRAEVNVGDLVRLEAGCDKRPVTCQSKFGNFLNFRGFPHIPGEDWLTSYPHRGGNNDGGSASPFPGQNT